MFFFHGLGLSVCVARGRIRWGNGCEDFDAVECISFCFLPIIPLRVIHVSHGQNPLQPSDVDTRHYPIRWSTTLVLRAFAQRWLWGLTVLAGLMVMGFLITRRPRIGAFLVGAFALTIASTGRWLMRRMDQRHREIRLLLGRHHFGSSDPASWRPSRFRGGSNPEAIYGTTTFAEAIPALIRAGEYSRAMWAARLCTAIEDPTLGEEWTDAILNEPAVRELLLSIEANPQNWEHQLLGST